MDLVLVGPMEVLVPLRVQIGRVLMEHLVVNFNAQLVALLKTLLIDMRLIKLLKV